MIDKYNDSDWLWLYIIINDKKKYITDIESDLIDKRYSYNETTWEFEKWQEAIDFEKETLIDNFKTLESKATWKRAEYLTAELLPLWTFKDMKLAKIEAERIELEAEYETIMTNLVTKYWENILNELL